MHKEPLAADAVFLVHDLFTPEECAREIARAEAIGFAEAGLGGGADAVVFKEVRDNDRVIFDEIDLAAEVYRRIAAFLPEWFGHRPTGLNERWRGYRYDPGQRFAPHTDGSFRRDNGEESLFTLLVYLNDDYEGGTTNFYLPAKKILKVRPRAGAALVFAHRMLHEGAAIERGRKYALRTDVMYSGERG